VVAFSSGVESVEKGVSPGQLVIACTLAVVQQVSEKIMEHRLVTFDGYNNPCGLEDEKSVWVLWDLIPEEKCANML
jgi:hypothetical protein